MVAKILADASPQKRLFISLITRDITLVDAMLDLIDNSINAALAPIADQLKTADDYQRLLANKHVKPKVEISIRIGSARIAIDDNAPGIPLEMAQKHVFKFGRDEGDEEPTDRLSVYGIGLKRAIFKCGNRISIVSDHRTGGFELKLQDVEAWAHEKTIGADGIEESNWTFPIAARQPVAKADCGTHIMITQLRDDVLRRIDDGLFLVQLRERIAKTYSVYIGRIVTIILNNEVIEKELFEIGANRASKKFKAGPVTCNVTAGMAIVPGDTFRERNAGWYIFCNGRAVLFADKSPVTGWGAGLPLFQAKHRAFLGTVFFVSANAEALPWSTTKSSINEESLIWQEARGHMVAVGRMVTRFLDSRYTGEGTTVAQAELRDAVGARMNVLDAAVAAEHVFKPPRSEARRTQKVSYDAKISDIRKIEDHLRKKMGGSEVGRFTFNWYLKNEVRGSN
ncbi:MAG TPA: ATP-binding protein [Rhizomicrobium sp.]|jgi:hypothetical protein|nr:ATP-binding protein [Rhizomicrobium sp.]